MFRRCWLLLAVTSLVAWCAVTAPSEHLGFTPGEDFKLADFSQIRGYFEKLDAASDRLRLVEFGKSSHGKPMLLAFISSAENLSRLDQIQRISQRMALGDATSEEAAELAKQGRAVVWIDSGLHATEVAPAQHAPELAYKLVTGETDEIRKIRQNVILMQVPVINPDGLDWVVHWYRENVGTPYELAPLPRLYQKYAGHDNNRDWFMLNLTETQHVTKLLYEEWFPHIVYNQHQQPAFPARIFVPPYAEPLNPNIPAAVMEGVHLIGAAMKERFARENKPGVISYFGFDGWWNGGIRTSPPFHNMHGILTETAAGVLGTPRVDEQKDLPKRFRNGLPTQIPTIFYQRPWLGGRWGVREAIDYMLTADLAILNHAATRPDVLLGKAYDLARASIEEGERGGPFAYIVPADQWDPYSAREMLRRLAASGITVHRAKAGFRVGEKDYAEGSFVLLAGQPFRPYLIDLMEPQEYPELRTGETGPTKRPYDVAGWTLRMGMGVDVDRVDDAFTAELEKLGTIPAVEPTLNPRDNSSYLLIADELSRGKKVRWGPSDSFELRKPRLALYEPYAANMDTGWTQWVLDTFRVPYTLVHNEDFRSGKLSNYDSIILASQSPMSILHGHRAGEPGRKRKPELDAKAQQRPEYTGGIGIAGLENLDRFVRQGGTLIAFDSATSLPIDYFPLAVRNTLSSQAGNSAERYYCPGSLIHITVDTSHPLAHGLREATIAFSRGGKAFEITLLEEANKGDRQIRSVASYAKSDLLASGWISGEKAVEGKHILIEAGHGKGKVILFGFRPQFRGQTFGTFKFLLNAIYRASAKPVQP